MTCTRKKPVLGLGTARSKVGSVPADEAAKVFRRACWEAGPTVRVTVPVAYSIGTQASSPPYSTT
ncbi:hypothetical protein ACFQT0_30065 [Hymenobacter humi]|uniref:Uncharacterized protein n=1 Tax=Hymenobacter humi TaxID=1411620 RepID=A0ABW2UDQ6_9BACT